MKQAEWNAAAAQAQIQRLIAPGVLGFYSYFEVTEIFANVPNQPKPQNVFSIAVAENHAGIPGETVEYLNSSRIKLKGLKGWTFGVARYFRSVAQLPQFLNALDQNSEWHASGNSLQVGQLQPLPIQFVPPDSLDKIPWNRVLKNNFWNGSYVLEWADPQKLVLRPLLDDPRVLQELSEDIRNYLPISLASLSDRLGNIAVQVPVTVLIAKFTGAKNSGDFLVKSAWHPHATPRPLRATCEIAYDGVVSAYACGEVHAPETRLRMCPAPGLHRGVLWDDVHQVILVATAPSSFITGIPINLSVSDPEPRIFTTHRSDGTTTDHRIALLNNGGRQIVGETAPIPNGNQTEKRIYAEEAARLAAQRRFVQYRPSPGSENPERERALGDLRLLIDQYGEQGVWLWDPYLSSSDLLETLFHCKYANTELRALTMGHESLSTATYASDQSDSGLSAQERFVERQRAVIKDARSNLRGLRLEYRIRTGNVGWGFHDRFLIFPRTESGALAWSLGTSVNSLGTRHHILQQVDDGQLVADSFLDLWEQLHGQEHLIWKAP